jgi:hypothetical protein
MAEQTGLEMQQAAHFAADGLSCIEPLIRRMDKTDVQQGRSERSGESYSLSYVEPLSDARTKLTSVYTIMLGADADAILDHIECFFRHDIFGNQFALHTIGTIGHDPIGHIFGQPEHKHHIAG